MINANGKSVGGVSKDVTALKADVVQRGINVKSAPYNATGDGVTNDTTGILAAFAVVGKKTIIIPDGQFYVNDTIVVNSDTTVIFIGTILEKVVGKNLFYANGASNITIINPRITGDGSGTTFVANQHTFYFNQCTNVKVDGGVISDIKGRAVVLFYNSTNCFVEKLKINNYSYSGIMCLHGCTNVQTHKNMISNCTNNTDPNIYPIMLSGYDVVSAPYPVAKDLFASGNTIDNTFPWWEGIDAHGGENIHIWDNEIKGSYTGIAVLSDSGTTWYANKVHIHHNTCIAPGSGTARDASNFGIVVSGASGYSFNFKIDNNIIDGFGNLTSSTTDLGGIKVISIEDVSLIGNTIKNTKTYGVRFISGCKKVDASHNKLINISGTSFGIHFDNTAHEGTVKDNLFTDLGTGIRGPSSSTDAVNTRIVEKGNVFKTIATANFTTLKFMVLEQFNASPQTTGITAGRIGDFTRNSTPASGQPFGWGCSVSGDGTATGTWIPTSNYP